MASLRPSGSRPGACALPPPCLALAVAVALLGTGPARSQSPAADPATASPGVRLADQTGFYGRLGLGYDWPEGSRYRDADCASTVPPALFGCGDGADGRQLGAVGDFDPTAVLDAALGYRVNDWLRAEALLSWRPTMDVHGQSNFLGAGSNQPVSGWVSSVAGFGVAYLDLPRFGQVRPFLGAGLGVAHNRMGAMTYQFPSLSATATTTTAGGSSTDLAYLLTAGLSIPLGDRVDLDLAYRYTDLGLLQTDSGQATVVRAAGTRSLAIAGTQADLQTHGVTLSVRYAF
jgi:opacity protein-like surface antigen